MESEPHFHLECDQSSVQLWTDVRLRFEPKGRMREARDSLRQALKLMVSEPDQLLNATFRSLDQGFCDVENILFYNVGAAAFRTVAAKGLRFERIHTVPPVSRGGRRFNHHHEYRLVEASQDLTSQPDCSLEFAFRSLTSSTKPHEIWWPASRAGTAQTHALNGVFEMRVVLHCPSPFLNLTSVIKPLLDGVICALHSDLKIDHEAVRRLAAKTGWKTDDIIHSLRSPKAPVLGPRRLLDVYRDFVKWNPADDRCEVCTVLYEPSSSPKCCVDVWDRQNAR